MNEYVRFGKGDAYVEVCCDWEGNYYSEVAWQFRGCIGEGNHSLKEMRKALIESFEITPEDLE